MMFRTYITTGICLRKRKKTDFKRLQYVVWRLFSKLHFLLNQEKYIKAMIYAKGKKSELRTSFHTKHQLKTIQKIEHNLAYMDYAMIFCL